MEALVEKHLSTVHDWEKNFNALKIKGKEVERLPRYNTEVKEVKVIFNIVAVFTKGIDGYSSFSGTEDKLLSYLLQNSAIMLEIHLSRALLRLREPLLEVLLAET